MKKATLFLLGLFLLLLTACNMMPMSSEMEMSHGEGMPMEMEMEMEMSPASTVTPGELTIENVQANLALPTDTGSVWLWIGNGTAVDEALIGAVIPGCGAVELHDMVIENDVMVMRQVPDGKIIIPAGQSIELKRGGLHIMCLQKEAPLEPGNNIDMVLLFANAGERPVTAPVVAPAGAMDMESMDDMHGSSDH
jgi:copper(I)-binding protein